MRNKSRPEKIICFDFFTIKKIRGQKSQIPAKTKSPDKCATCQGFLFPKNQHLQAARWLDDNNADNYGRLVHAKLIRAKIGKLNQLSQSSFCQNKCVFEKQELCTLCKKFIYKMQGRISRSFGKFYVCPFRDFKGENVAEPRSPP